MLVAEAIAINAVTHTQFGATPHHNAIDALLEIVDVAISNMNMKRKVDYFEEQKFWVGNRFLILL